MTCGDHGRTVYPSNDNFPCHRILVWQVPISVILGVSPRHVGTRADLPLLPLDRLRSLNND